MSKQSSSLQISKSIRKNKNLSPIENIHLKVLFLYKIMYNLYKKNKPPHKQACVAEKRRKESSNEVFKNF